jgi:hypothetical protein
MEPMRVNDGGNRTAGAGLVVGMVLLVAGVAFHPSEFDPAMRSYPRYVPIHVGIAMGLVAGLPGLLLVLKEYLRTASLIDRIAALCCTWGWTLFTSQILLEGLAVPVMQRQVAGTPLAFLEGPVAVFYVFGAACFALGFVLLGWRLPRAGAPAWASRLLMIAPVPVLWPPVPDVLGKCAVAVFAIGMARLGVWLTGVRSTRS